MAFKDEVGSLDRIASAVESIAEGGSSLDSLSDVDLSNPTDGQTLVYNGTTHKWENGSSSGGSSVLVVQAVEGVLDATYKQIVDAIHSNGAIYEEVSITGFNAVANFTEYGHDAESGMYWLTTFANTGAPIVHSFMTDSENGYPVNEDL